MHRSTRLRLGVVLAVIAVVATAAFLVDRQYGPVAEGAFDAPYPFGTRAIAYDHRYGTERLAAPPGGSAQELTSLENEGSRSLTVTATDPTGVAEQILWSPYRLVPGGYGTGVGTRWRPFPAELPAHGTIRLLLTIHRPHHCAGFRGPGIDLAYDGTVLVHWDSLLGSHTTSVATLLRPIHMC